MEPQPRLVELNRSFNPPPGLGRARPREIRLTAGGRALVVVAVILFAAALATGVVMQRVAIGQDDERRLLAGEGVVTNGTVERVWRSNGDSKQPWVSYRIEVVERPYEGRSKIALSRWRGLHVGDALQVRYLPADPRLSVLAGTELRAMPLWLQSVVAAAIGTFGVACLLWLRVQRRLLMDGRAAPAIVTRHISTHTSHGGSHRFIVYEFPLPSGATASGKASTSRKPPAIGSVICVLYDPERPRRSQPYPLQLVRPAVLSNP